MTIIDDDVWPVIQSYFQSTGILQHQIAAMNCFYHESIPNVIESYKRTVITSPKHPALSYILEFSNHILEAPTQSPMECQDRNMSYCANFYLDIKITPPRGDPIVRPKTPMGMIPVMVYSDLCMLSPLKGDHRALAALNECVFDTGGYFLTRVVSKDSKARDTTTHRMIIIPQERAVPNRIFTFENKKQKPMYSVYSEIRTTTVNGFQTLFIIGYLPSTKIFSTVIPKCDYTIPMCILFTALGVCGISDIYNHCKLSGEFEQETLLALQRTFEHSYEIETQYDALEYIGRLLKESAKKKKKLKQRPADVCAVEESIKYIDSIHNVQFAIDALSRDIFSHINCSDETQNLCELSDGTSDGGTPVGGGVGGEPFLFPKNLFHIKARFLGFMVYETVCVLEKKKPATDRDHFSFKRVMDVNILLEQQFRSAILKIVQDVKNVAIPALEAGTGADIFSAIKTSTVTTFMIGAIAGNNWSRGTAKGVSQIIDQFNFTGGEANKRKITVPLSAQECKSSEPRDIHQTNYNKICPGATPEGKDTGLRKHLALGANITMGAGPGVLTTLFLVVKKLGMVSALETDYSMHNLFVLINGDFAGTVAVENADTFISDFKNLRRCGNLSRDISVSKDDPFIRIFCDQGRLVYPAFIVEQGCLVIDEKTIEKLVEQKNEVNWEKLCNSGYIELLDTDEELNTLIAHYPSQVTQDHTHCELHPSLMYGVGASLIPFPDHNQSPRNCYQSNMTKQGMGMPFSNYQHHLSGKFHVLEYLQRPICVSRLGSIVGYNSLPAGQNAMVCIMPGPFNEEDSLMISKSSIQRGFMVSGLYISYFVEEKNREKFMKPVPGKVKMWNDYNFDKLGDDGVVKKGTRVKNGDVLVNKLIVNSSGEVVSEKAYTTVYTETTEAVVDKIKFGKSGDGYNYVRVMVVQRREPVIGDKFAARHSQKGTVGMVVNDVDLPFTRQGITPDIVVNALAFPSRMTIAMLVELLTGKVVCAPGVKSEASDLIHNVSFQQLFGGNDHLVDATPFRKFDFAVIKNELRRLGITELCDEVMTCGITGKEFTSLIFNGPVHYQRLRHMVVDKIHARPRGQRTTITRQPTEGRRAGGGMRNGVQERDNFLGVGAPHIARDRLFMYSDRYMMWFCDVCGLQAIYNEQTKEKRCNVCSTNKISQVMIPYGTKLVFQELQGMGIFPRIMTSQH